MISTTTTQELQARPYGERQQVLVVPDDLTQVGRADQAAASGLKTRLDRTRHRLPRWTPGSRRTRRDALNETIRDLRDEGVLFMALTTREASKLSMPVGHPRPSVMYIGNPVATEKYYPLADFHRQVFEHKFAESIRLVMALGATEMRIVWERGWRREVAADIQGPLQKLIRGSGEVKAHRGRNTSLLFEASLMPNDPALPSGLLWYPHEPTWQAVAEGRSSYRLTDFELRVESREDYGVDASLESKVRRKKLLSIGGEFTAFERTSWRIEGRFADAPKKRWFRSGEPRV